MKTKDEIIRYLISEYNPEAIVSYGSYADGSANANSDFDALVIAESSKKHDESVVCGVTLDVFIYSPEEIAEVSDPDEFIQIHDGKIEFDKNGVAEKLQKEVLQYIDNMPMKTSEEIIREVELCKKMFLRTAREDAEGYYRWHWLLMDSLEIYYDIIKKHYFGPKKALKQMQQCDEMSYTIYEDALTDFSREKLSRWIDRIEYLAAGNRF